jgi:hypothetical protein
MQAWIPVEAFWWLGLYGGFGVVAYCLLLWSPKRRQGIDTSFRTLFQRGELGLFALFIAISVILDLHRSGLSVLLVGAMTTILVISGLMAASAWLEDSRVAQGIDPNQDERTWTDSRKLLFLVFSIAFTTEVLLAHSAEVWR